MTDAYLLDPYQLNLSRYYQLLKVAAVRTGEEARHREQELAWHAWQTTAHEFGSTKKKPPGLKEWMAMVGVQTADGKSAKPAKMTEEEKTELFKKTMSFVANDSLRTASRAGHKDPKRKRNMTTPRG